MGADTSPDEVSFNVSTTNTSSYCRENLSPDEIFSEKVFVYVSLVFVTIGLVTNVLNVLVFSSKEMRKISSSVYLLVLAISDALYLVSVFLTKLLNHLHCMYFQDIEMDISNQSDFLCVFLQYLSDLFSDLSSCLVLAFTIERLVAVFLPVKMKQLSTVHLAWVICGILFVVLGISIAPYHVICIGRKNGKCVITVEVFSDLYIVEMVLFRVIPVLVIAVLNTSIIIRVTQLRKMRSQQKQTPSCSRLQPPTNGHHLPRRTGDDKGLQLTIMLILVSTTYIITFLPVLIHFVIQKVDRQAKMEVSKHYTSTLYIVGFGINFFLYTMSGTIFRQQLKVILCRQRNTQPKYLASHTETHL